MKTLKTMTVGELRKYLERFPDSLPVVSTSPAGDYWRTVLAVGITKGELQQVEYTNYHECYKLVDDEDAEGTEALVLS